MAEPDFNIIKSPEGKRMLKTVSQDFYNHSYIALWLFEVMGREWDEASEWTKSLKYEAFPQSCTWSISIWEKAYGIVPDESLTLEYRRQRVLAKKIQRVPVNPETVRKVAETITGTNIAVIDPIAPYSFKIVIYPRKRDKPFSFEELQESISTMKPSHLRVLYEFVKNIWLDAQQKLFIWKNTNGWTWREFQRYRLEVEE